MQQHDKPSAADADGASVVADQTLQQIILLVAVVAAAVGGAVAVNVAKVGSVTAVCVALIGNKNVIPKDWTVCGITIDCLVCHFGLQQKSLRRDVVRIFQTEKETFLTMVPFEAVDLIPPVPFLTSRLPFDRRKPTEDVPVCIQNQGHCICMAVASVVELGSAEAVTDAPPQQFELFSAELCEDRRKVRNDPRPDRTRRAISDHFGSAFPD
jgi:hypothetical protein